MVLEFFKRFFKRLTQSWQIEPLPTGTQRRIQELKQRQAARKIRFNFEKLSHTENQIRADAKFNGLLNLTPEQLSVLKQMSLDEIDALEKIPERFRKPFITQLPLMIKRDILRWEHQENPQLADGPLQLKSFLVKGGGKHIPSAGGDSSDLIPIDERHAFYTMLDIEGKGASANEPRNMVQGFLRGYLAMLRSLIRETDAVSGNNLGSHTFLHPDKLNNSLKEFVNSAERTHNEHYPDVACYGRIGYFKLNQATNNVLFRYVPLGGEPMFVLRKKEDGTHFLEMHGGTSSSKEVSFENGELNNYDALGHPFGPLHAVFGPYTAVDEIVLRPGDKLVNFTDGLSEARDHTRTEFGHQRIVELLQKNAHRSASQLIRILKVARERHIRKNITAGGYTPDDMRIRVFEVVRHPEPRHPELLQKPAQLRSGEHF